MFGITEKEDFLLALKYQECPDCGNTMFCRWGCMAETYPKGMADYGHKRWEELIRVYVKYYDEHNIDSDPLAEHVRRAKLRLAEIDERKPQNDA